jgi:segregation and condensation protein B
VLFQEREMAALEALLFVAKEPLSIEKLGDFIGLNSEEAQEVIQALNRRY